MTRYLDCISGPINCVDTGGESVSWQLAPLLPPSLGLPRPTPPEHGSPTFDSYHEEEIDRVEYHFQPLYTILHIPTSLPFFSPR